MPGTFLNKDKLTRAQEAVVAQGGDKEDWKLVLAEYQKLGGAYRDDPDDPLLPTLKTKESKGRKVASPKAKKKKK